MTYVQVLFLAVLVLGTLGLFLKSGIRVQSPFSAGETDPWEGAQTTHVGRFRRELEWFADEISLKGSCYVVSTRFNAAKRCVEFFDKRGVVAEVCINGERGCPPSKVVLYSNLSLEDCMVFASLFERLNMDVEFLLLPGADDSQGSIAA